VSAPPAQGGAGETEQEALLRLSRSRRREAYRLAVEAAEAIAENKEAFARDFAWSMSEGWYQAWNGDLGEFAAQRLSDALQNRLHSLFTTLGELLFDKLGKAESGLGNLLFSGLNSIFGSPKAYASGGSFGAGEVLMTGELGPELVATGAAGTVLNAASVRALAGQATRPATNHVSQHFHLHAEGAVMTNELMAELDARASQRAAAAANAAYQAGEARERQNAIRSRLTLRR
jgi:hypothetical protein